MRCSRIVAAAVLGLAGCGNYTLPTEVAPAAGTPGSSVTVKDCNQLFALRVQPRLDYCRNCHVPGGVADVPDGHLYMLSQDKTQDFANLRASWEALGRNDNGKSRILKMASGTDTRSHTGGAPWPVGSDAYKEMDAQLLGFVDPSACNLGVLGGATQELPLLGNPGKHYFVTQICDGKPDDTPIDWTQDPRRLMSGDIIDSDAYAVHFNDPFEICHNDTLIENQTKENALLVAAGKRPIHTAKPYAKTCGEWRARVKEGHDWIAMSPTDTPREGGEGNGNVLGSQLTASASADTWNKLWMVWGMPGRPDNYDEQVSERYGHSITPDHIHNPYPLPGEEGKLTKTFGGTGRLPLGWAQGRDAAGNYNGHLGLDCFSCHGGQIGSGEVVGRDGNGDPQSYGANPYGTYMGLPNTNTELGVLLADLIHAQQPVDLHVPAFGYIPLVNTTRGTNAADTEIEAIVAIRDFDTLNFQHVFVDPAHGSFGDQDPPAWWWLHNKTRYLWFGGHSTDSSRGNMYFGSVNGLPGDQVRENEGIFESVHDWTLTVEAPDWPDGYCSNADGNAAPGDKPHCINHALAERGAILFHEKNLWDGERNADIPKPKGSGSCAGCHGAYSPRYAGDKRFLPDPKMIGETGYTVPIEIVGTDPAQATGWAKDVRPHVSTFWWSYPDAQPDYLYPENKNPLQEELDDYAATDGISGPAIVDQLGRTFDQSGSLQPLSDLLVQLAAQTNPQTGLPLGAAAGRVKGACSFEEKTVGYVTPPLHGVWASAPYFHNGSVPTVWDVLKPSDRPAMWRRVRTTTNVAFNAFEHRLSAYDFDKLGWKHDVLECSAGAGGIPYYQCEPSQPVPPEIQWLYDAVDGGLIWPTWLVPPPIGDQGLADRMIYNTNMYSKKNRGHEWTKVLTDEERAALIEYLKTL